MKITRLFETTADKVYLSLLSSILKGGLQAQQVKGPCDTRDGVWGLRLYGNGGDWILGSL